MWIKTCPECGVEFKTDHRNQITCGHICKYERHSKFLKGKTKPALQLTCKVCGNIFFVSKHRNRSSGFCSPTCSISRFHGDESVEIKRMSGFQRSPKTGKMETNVHARHFHLMCPNGVDYHGLNVAHFVRTHPHLFSKEELRTTKSGHIYAATGLIRLRPSDRRKKSLITWHGWTWISILDRRFNDGEDLISRKPIDNPSVLAIPSRQLV